MALVCARVEVALLILFALGGFLVPCSTSSKCVCNSLSGICWADGVEP